MFPRVSPIAKTLCFALLLTFPTLAKTQTLINMNFDNLTPSLNATALGQFSVTGGSVDVVGGSLFGNLCAPPESGNCVDLTGSTGAAGQISSAVLTLKPGTYNLSFDLIGSQRGLTTSTTVSLGSFLDETFVLPSGDDSSGIVSTVITVGTTTMVPLKFTSNTPGNIGALLDNVKLASTLSPTPEP